MAAEQAPALAVCDRWEAAVAIAAVAGEIDIATAGILTRCLGELARKNPERLIIDLAGVSFIDSSGLGALVRLRKMLPADCPVVLRSPQRQVRRVFKITGLDTVFAFE